MVRVLINGVEPINNPIGVDDLSERYYFSDEFFGYLYEIKGNLTFYGDDFEYFYNLLKISNCESLTVELNDREGENGAWKQIFVGLIYVNDLKFDADKRTVQAEIIDDSFIARLISYSETPIELFQAQSRGGVPLSISGTLISVDDVDGNVIPNITGYTVLDMLNYIVAFITDATITVQSTFLSSSPADKYFFVLGTNMRYFDFPMSVTFKEVLVDLIKIWNLRWSIQNISGQTVLVIEEADYFEESGLITLDNLRDFKFEYFERYDYSTLTFGSFNAASTNTSSNAYISETLKRAWAAHNDSSVTPDGECSTKRVLDLRTKTVCYDCNAISDCVNNVSDSNYDQTLFYVCDTADSLGTVYVGIRITNPDLFVKYQMQRWINSYCFSYPGSLSTCDSALYSDGTYIVNDNSAVQFQIFDPEGCLFDNNEIPPLSGMVNIELKLILEPLQTTPYTTGLAKLFFTTNTSFTPWLDPDNFIAPDLTNGWVNGPAVGQVPFRNYVDFNFNVNDIVVYEGFMENVLISNDYVFLILNLGFGDIGAMTILEGSYIKVTNSASNLVYNECIKGSYKVESSGFITTSKADSIRNSRFGNLLLPNRFNNFSGNIIELERKLQSGETKLSINTITI